MEALSGRDIEAVNKTVSGLTKLLFPDPELAVSDADLEWIVRLALESRRRVKEQQKRCFKSEFRNTHFSYISGPDGIELRRDGRGPASRQHGCSSGGGSSTRSGSRSRGRSDR